MQVSLLRRPVRLLTGCAWVLVSCFDGRQGESNAKQGAAALGWTGPQFTGAGSAGLGHSIAAGLPALSCGNPKAFAFTNGPALGARSHLSCFYDRTDQAAATIEWIVESADEQDLVHVRLTLNPDFVDNTYGQNAIGWPAKQGPAGMMPAGMPTPANAPAMKGGPKQHAPHSFADLVGSDHAEFKLSDAAGNLVLHFKQDYISVSSSAPSGYETLGVSGGDGRMIAGDATKLVAFSTSLDRDLNACGLSSYTTDSPATDADYALVKGAEAWDYRVVYDVWVSEDAFGKAGFGDAVVDFVHASPSKQDGATAIVTKRECPPDWKRYCNDPAGCMVNRCGDVPDDSCSPPGLDDRPDSGTDSMSEPPPL